MCVCSPSRLYHLSTARRSCFGGEGNALNPVLASVLLRNVQVLSLPSRGTHDANIGRARAHAVRYPLAKRLQTYVPEMEMGHLS